MLDIRFVRENPDAVKENIKKKFQDAKLPLVDEVIKLDAEYRAAIGEASDLRANRNKLSKQIGALMGQAKKDPSKAAEAEEIKKQVTAQADRLKELEAKETELQAKIQEIMYTCLLYTSKIVDDTDDLILISQNGILIRIHASDINTQSR